MARRCVASFYPALATPKSVDVRNAMDRWKELLGTATGHDLDRPEPHIDRLARLYGVPAAGVRPAALLMSVHTVYALVVKTLVWQAFAARGMPAGTGLHAAMTGMEQGRIAQVRPVVGSAEENPFGWYTAAWTPEIETGLREMLAQVSRSSSVANSVHGDLFKPLYESLLPKQVRHRLGEYYTPDWLARHVLERAGFSGESGRSVLDPACGSGTFLLTAIRRIRGRLDKQDPALAPAECLDGILRNVVGFDLNPLAVLAARANYLLAIGDLLDDGPPPEIPVHLRDAILPGPVNPRREQRRFDYVAGNPPWIAWDDLPEPYRRATQSLWKQYGLFSLSGSDARHGGGKKDLSMLLTYIAADRYLKRGGRLAFVLTQTVFQTKGAGDGFRRFRLGESGQPLAVLHVDDMVRLRPFAGAANWTATIALEKGRKTSYPIPYTIWSPGGRPGSDEATGEPLAHKQPCLAEPVDPNRPNSPWFIRPPGFERPLAELVGPSDYRAHLGANSGGANGVYWVEVIERTDCGILIRNRAEKNRRETPEVTVAIEPELLYPLLCWGDVARWRAVPRGHLLLAQDVESRRGIEPLLMQGEYPKTYAYLKRFEPQLRDRAAYKRYQHRAAFYSMYNVGRYTVAPWKVVWRRMDRRMQAAVVGPVDDPLLGPRSVVPQETCVLVPVDSPDEAHYVCAVLNSALIDLVVRAHSVSGGKGFGTPSILDYVSLRRFDPADPIHAELADRGRRAHEAAMAGAEITEIQREIDLLSGRLRGLREDEVAAIRREAENRR